MGQLPRRPTVLHLVLLPLLLVGCVPAHLVEHTQHPPPPPAAAEDGIAVYFSPHGGAMSAIVAEVDAARRSVDVAAYLITARQFVDALDAARRRGVRVRIILDKKHAGGIYSAAPAIGPVAQADLPVWRDGRHKEAHNKVILIDGHTVITGSFNFTDPAEERNAENLLIIRGKPDIFAAYQSDFEAHLAHSDAPRRQ